jgi:hypothetical protein
MYGIPSINITAVWRRRNEEIVIWYEKLISNAVVI